MEIIYLGLFMTALGSQLFFWLFIVGRLNRWRDTGVGQPVALPAVSVVICARNELENLQRHLPMVLAQDYPDFEVVVVDDGSTDGSGAYLRLLASAESHLTVVTMASDRSCSQGKKPALEKGIVQARGPLVLLTDADCQPVSATWIRQMTACAPESVDLVIGYSPYSCRPGWLNLFIRMETVYTAFQYVGFAMTGMPYMGVGRNMLYRKSLWESVGGFSAHAAVTGGDDDLFVSAVVSSARVAVCLDPKSFVESLPAKSVGEYISQKRRHVSTSVKYKLRSQLVLGWLSASHALVYLLVLVGLVWLVYTEILIVLFVLRMVIVAIQYKRIGGLLGAGSLWGWAPVFDALLPMYHLLMVPGLFLSRRKNWGGRVH